MIIRHKKFSIIHIYRIGFWCPGNCSAKADGHSGGDFDWKIIIIERITNNGDFKSIKGIIVGMLIVYKGEKINSIRPK